MHSTRNFINMVMERYTKLSGLYISSEFVELQIAVYATDEQIPIRFLTDLHM